jgi:5-methylcytosine-specific restriction endonuclease McrA
MTQVRSDDWQSKQLRIRFKAFCRAQNALCWLCVQRGADPSFAQIDYDAAPNTPNSFELDHFKPWETYPHLRYEWHNARPSHSRCNRQRGRRMQASVGAHNAWVKPDRW